MMRHDSDVFQYICDRFAVDGTYLKNNNIDALHQACERGNLDVVRYLIDDERRFGITSGDINATIPMSRELPIGGGIVCTVCANGHIDILRYLHRCSRIVINCDVTGALIAACANGYMNIVRYLCEAGDGLAVDVCADNNHALRAACAFGHLRIVQYLSEILCFNIGAPASACELVRIALDNRHHDIAQYIRGHF